eukprot:TRINITY_DN2124_c0_g1_i1.p1 TRINITY_DN2124_c0_g1~~TRINITY_DN2124_c0_g1_i1.p1  ORF type:complete len:256 (-),score=25.54 TRINITY_DN2124_c0_g1_i1:327-1094(-)
MLHLNSYSLLKVTLSCGRGQHTFFVSVSVFLRQVFYLFLFRFLHQVFFCVTTPQHTFTPSLRTIIALSPPLPLSRSAPASFHSHPLPSSRTPTMIAPLSPAIITLSPTSFHPLPLPLSRSAPASFHPHLLPSLPSSHTMVHTLIPPLVIMIKNLTNMTSVYHNWYRLVETQIPGKSVLQVIKKVLADQTLMAPLVITTLFFSIGWRQGKSFDQTWKVGSGGHVVVVVVGGVWEGSDVVLILSKKLDKMTFEEMAS